MNFLMCLFCCCFQKQERHDSQSCIQQEQKQKQKVHGQVGLTGDMTNNILIKQNGSKIEETNTTDTKTNLQIRIDDDWDTIAKNDSNIKDRVNKLLLERWKQKTPILHMIRYGYKRILISIKNKRLVININLQQMIKNDANHQKKSSIIFSNIQLDSFVESFQTDWIQILLSNIYVVLENQYKILIHHQDQKKQYKKSFIPKLKEIKQSYFQLRKMGSNIKIEDKDIFMRKLGNFLKDQIIRQYLLAIRYILGCYEVIKISQVCRQIKYKWMELEEEINQHTSLEQIQNKCESFCIVNGKFLDQNQKHSIYQQDLKNSEQSSSRSMEIDTSKSSKQISITDRQIEKQNDMDKGFSFIKYYSFETKKMNQQVKNIRYLKYVVFESKSQQQKYQMRALLRENQMNLIRYLSQEKLQGIARFSITKDQEPQKEPLTSHQQSQQRKIFEFVSQKGDKDYSSLYKKSQKINKYTIWNYGNYKIIYSFLKSMVYSIRQFQKHFIHQTDFQYENFIKFKNVFLAIDFDKAFFVEGEGKSKDYFNQNRKMWKCWLNSIGVLDSFSCLISTQGSYEEIKKQYLKHHNQNQAINQCMNLMYKHMQRNHMNQFYSLAHQLLSPKALKYQAFPLGQQQLQKIIQILPKSFDDTHFKYQVFLKKLQQIYQQYNENIFLCNQMKSSQNTSIDLISNQICLASSFLRNIASNHKPFKKKIFYTIRFMKQKPFQYTCEYKQQIFQYKDDLMLSTLDNSVSFNSSVFENTKFVILFLKSLIKLIREVQASAFLLLYFDLGSFVQSGQKFILNNLAFLFKINSKPDEKNRRQIDKFIKISCQAFFQLYLWNNENLRKRIFFFDLQKLVNENLFNHQEDSSVESDTNLGTTYGNISSFLSKYSSYIHYQQFKRIMRQIISEYSNQDEIISKINQIVETKDQSNYLDMIPEIPEVIYQSQ